MQETPFECRFFEYDKCQILSVHTKDVLCSFQNDQIPFILLEVHPQTKNSRNCFAFLKEFLDSFFRAKISRICTEFRILLQADKLCYHSIS